jgi:hypothetical protein
VLHFFSAPDAQVKIVDDDTDLDSILKSMLGGEQSTDEMEDASSTSASSADSQPSVAHTSSTDSTTDK